MRKRLSWVAAAAMLTGVFVSCRSGSPDGPAALFLSDLLTGRGVLSSSLRTPPPGLPPDSLYPKDSEALDPGSSDPLGLRRNIDLGPTALRILYAPPRSEYAWDLDLPGEPVFRFGVGVVLDNRSEALLQPRPSDAGVEFIVRLESAGFRRTLFQKRLDVPSTRAGHPVSYGEYQVRLPGGGRKARLILMTGGVRRAFAFWHDPKIEIPAREDNRPNIVLVSLDTLRADHVGAYGYRRPTTPNLDALAAESTVFLNAYATSSWTLPSHTSMLSGWECGRHQVYYETEKVGPRVPLLADLLHRNGYSCAAFTGGGYLSAAYGFAAGFGLLDQEGGDRQSSTLAGEAGKRATAWLANNPERPFFLFVHTYQIHEPYKPPPPYADLFLGPAPKWRRWDIVSGHGGRKNIFKPLPETDRRNVVDLYDGGVRYTDDALIRPLLEALKARKDWPRTLLIVTSDHGEEFFEHGGWGHARTVYDESIRIPLIVRFPKGRWAGRPRTVVRITDIVPTALEAAGIPVEKGAFDGLSLRPVAQGRERADRTFTAELAEGVTPHQLYMHAAMNSGKRKLILNGEIQKTQLEYYAVMPSPQPPLELYDLSEDAGETANLIDSPQPEDRRLLARLQAVARTMKAKADHTVKRSRVLEEQLRALGYLN